MIKVIIAGGRDFNNYEELSLFCDKILANQKDVEIVSGTANGADKLGERYARERGYAIKQFPADWDGLGKRAGHVRNAQMAEYADALIAFWDSKSKGTQSMIGLANAAKLKVRIKYYKVTK